MSRVAANPGAWWRRWSWRDRILVGIALLDVAMFLVFTAAVAWIELS